MKGNNNTIMIGKTTVSSKKDAENIVRKLLESNLIACGEIEGPISTIYRWNEKIVEDKEWRVTVKFPKNVDPEIQKEVTDIHPYELPQWINWEVETSQDFKTWVSSKASP